MKKEELKGYIRVTEMGNKLFGFILLLTAGIICAYLVKDGYNRRKKALSGFLWAVDYIISKISVFNTPVPTIFSELSEKKEAVGGFFGMIYEEISSGKGLKAGFERAMKEDWGLKSGDYTLLEDLRESLGEGDREAQLEAVRAVRDEISKCLDNALEEEKRKLKYEGALTLSVFAVLGIVLL